MKKREKIMGINEHLNEGIVREKFWYFSEEKEGSFNPEMEFSYRSIPDSYSKTIRGRNDRIAPRFMGRNRNKRECTFVVDWQLSDSV